PQEFLVDRVHPALGSQPVSASSAAGQSRPVGRSGSMSIPEMKLRARPAWLVGVLGLLWLVGAPPRVLGATGVQKCAGAKVKAFGAAVQARVVCQAEARLAGGGVDPACLSKVEKKLAKRLAKAN